MARKKVSKRRTARRKAAPAAARTTVAKRRTLPVYHIDAFTSRVFHGNPAAVVILDGQWPDDDVMQGIAGEFNLPMTAFVRSPRGRSVGLRWFNGQREFDLCGHATLAAANVLWTHERVRGASIDFTTASGPMPVTREGDRIVLHMRAKPAVRVRVTNQVCAALGRAPTEAHVAGTMLLTVFDNKRAIHELDPNMALVERLDAHGIIATAPGAGHDFVSRYFAPKHGLGEDHATGSSHCTLVPYRADRLRKVNLSSHQVSRRGGEMWCELAGSRVLLGGHAVTFGKGSITI